MNFLASCRTLPLLVILLSGVAAAQPHKQHIPLGLIVPLTGTNAYIGERAGRMAQLFAEDFNSTSGKYVIDLLIEDGKCGQGNFAATAAHKLIHINKAKFLITGCSGETLQVAPLAEKAKVVVLAMASNHPDVSRAGDFIFRTYLDVDSGLQELAQYIRTAEIRRMALITEDLAFTQGTRERLNELLGDLVVFQADYLPDAADYRDILIKSKASKPEAYYLNCATPSTCARLYSQVGQLGIRARLFSYFYPEFADVAAAVGQSSEEMIYLAPPDITLAPESYRRIMDKYIRQFGLPELQYFTRTTHVALDIIAAVIQETGDDPDKARDFIYSFRGDSAIGRVYFDKAGDIRGVSWTLKSLKDGKKSVLAAGVQ